VDRFREVLKNDPEFTRRDGVYFHLAEALLQMNLAAEAIPYLDRLVKEFERSEYLARAQKLLADAKAGTPVEGLKKDTARKNGGAG
jgi:outer membrane protein assembly factor BamD (BamD/ComL family)